MSRKKFTRSSKFNNITSDIEDEILESYAQILELNEEEQDMYLNQLPELFKMLKIPNCYVKDISTCIEYYYMNIVSNKVTYNPELPKHLTVMDLFKSYTITTQINDTALSFHDIIDIIDVDKLIKRCGKLIKFRNNHRLILESWKLFVNKVSGGKEVDILSYKLTLPDLQILKKELSLEDELSDSLLIDMLGSCSTVNGEIVNYDWEKLNEGKYVSIRDFAEIMGHIGELD